MVFWRTFAGLFCVAVSLRAEFVACVVCVDKYLQYIIMIKGCLTCGGK